MKLIFASDIHGGAQCCQELIDKYKSEKAEKLILLGDLLYHGPRNDLPEDYAPKKVINILNENKKEILAVRGNCEAEVDQMVLEFPVLADYMTLWDKGKMFFCTHGHLYNEMPFLKEGDITIQGHTHIYDISENNGYTYINTGSVTLPKNNNPRTYILYENGLFKIKDFNNNILKELQI